MAGPIQVIVKMYSGRPDPVLDLTAQEVEELRQRLEHSRSHPVREHRALPQLGYRGFVVTNESRVPGFPYEAEIYGGFISALEDRPQSGQETRAHRRVFQDSERLEEWLLERATERGLAEDIAHMGGPQRRPPKE